MFVDRLKPRYLIRFDDVCPTFPWAQWSPIEELLISQNIRPIMAVIPDNRDRALHFGPADQQFWNRVRAWKKMEWTIGLHGHQHVYVSKSRGIVGLNRYSEFSGVSFDEQRMKLRAALEIFEQEGVQPDLWVAPAHTFDENTLLALKSLQIKTISDGFQLWPHTDRDGFFWIPQQLGNFYFAPFGTWTVCIHCSDRLYTHPDVFRQTLERFGRYIADVPEIISLYSNQNPNRFNQAFARAFRWAKVLKSAVT